MALIIKKNRVMKRSHLLYEDLFKTGISGVP